MGGWSRSACMNLIALQAACAAADPDGVEDTEVEAPATARWMAEVFAASPDVPVGRILIPGAFNSSSYACDAANGMSPDAPGVVQALFGSEDTPNDDPNRQRVVDWAKTQDRRCQMLRMQMGESALAGLPDPTRCADSVNDIGFRHGRILLLGR